MNTERLLRLASVLDNVDPAKFNLEQWGCGTTACACGIAATIPEFVEAGFKLKMSISGPYPIYKYLNGWEAVCSFFELSKDEAEYLFLDESYPFKDLTTADEVTARIRKVVEDYQKLVEGK